MYRKGPYENWENEVIIKAIHENQHFERVAKRLNRKPSLVRGKMDYESAKIFNRVGSREDVLNKVDNMHKANIDKQKEVKKIVQGLKYGKHYKIYDRQAIQGEEIKIGELTSKDETKFILRRSTMGGSYIESFRILDLLCGDIEIIK